MLASHGVPRGKAQGHFEASLEFRGQASCSCSWTLLRGVYRDDCMFPGFQVQSVHRIGSLDVPLA